MAYEDDLTRQLATSTSEDAQRDVAAERSIPVQLKALARLQAQCVDAAKFLAEHHVPTEPLFVESMKRKLWVGEVKVQRELAQGWILGLGNT